MPASLKRRWAALSFLCCFLVLSFLENAGFGFLKLPHYWGVGITQGTWEVAYARIRPDGTQIFYGDKEGFKFEKSKWSATPMFGIPWPPVGKESLGKTSYSYVTVQHWVVLLLTMLWILFAEFRHRRKRRREQGGAG